MSQVPPAVIMADGSAAVTASCKEILPLSKRLMCWYHASKKIQDRLKGIKNIDAKVSTQIYSDIQTLQAGAYDEESFFLLAALMKRKWLEEKIYIDETLKLRVTEFFLYFNNTWLNSDINKWYEAANPMMLSTNNSLEAHNNVLKRDYTGRKRLSMPDLVNKLKEMIENWSKNPVEEKEREPSLPIRKQAEELLKDLESFILFRAAKSNDRAVVKRDIGVVRGTLKYVGICPRIDYQLTSRENFANDGKAIIARRQSLDYDGFDDFKADLKKVAVMEVVKLESGVLAFFCNCYNFKSVSGCKGGICVHVCAKLIQKGIIPKLPVPRQMSSTVAKKRMPKNMKQTY